MTFTPEKQPLETFSVEEGYIIGTVFFLELWPLVEPKIIEEDRITGTYTLFFLEVCSWNEYCAEWNEAVRRVTDIPKTKQPTLQLSLPQIFQCTLEFCKLHNKQYENRLIYVVKILESMKEVPQQYQVEWGLWGKAVRYAQDYFINNNDFNWNANPAWPYK